MNEGKLDKKTSLKNLDNDTLNDIRDGYYGISEHIQSLKYAYVHAAYKNKDWADENKIFKQIQNLFNKLDTGKIL